MNDIPAEVLQMAQRGPAWAEWVKALAGVRRDVLAQWQLTPDGDPTDGFCSLVIPVRTAEGQEAMLKLAFPDEESEHEALALAQWEGAAAVRLLTADPHRRALLLERLEPRDRVSYGISRPARSSAGSTGRCIVRLVRSTAGSRPASIAGLRSWPRCPAVHRSRAGWWSRRCRWVGRSLPTLRVTAR